MERIEDIYTWQRDLVINAYERGMRADNLDTQPAPWMINGLKALEAGKTLTAAMIKQFNS